MPWPGRDLRARFAGRWPRRNRGNAVGGSAPGHAIRTGRAGQRSGGLIKKDKQLVALDVGSTKTCAIIGELDDAGVKFVSMGAAESKGTRKGLIANLSAMATSVRRAIEEAESAAGVPVERALVGVAGSQIRGVNSRGGITLGHRPRDIEREDVRRAVDAARNVTLPDDRVVLHVLPQEFFLDAQDNIRDPVGMVGQRLEVNVQLVTSSASAMQN